MLATAKLRFHQLNGRSYNARHIALGAALVIALAILFGDASPVFAQTEDLVNAIGNVVTTITDIIQGVAIAAGIAGLSVWGFSKVARPVFPQISQLAAMKTTPTPTRRSSNSTTTALSP